jgi:hypothetical protein
MFVLVGTAPTRPGPTDVKLAPPSVERQITLGPGRPGGATIKMRPDGSAMIFGSKALSLKSTTVGVLKSKLSPCARRKRKREAE